MNLFNRAWRLQVGTLLLSQRDAQGQTGLAAAFKVTKSLATARAGTASITVYNLPPALSREIADLPRRSTFVSIDAGYVGGISRLFTGDLRKATPSREGADWKMEVEAGDGVHARRTARVSRAFAPGTSLDGAADALATALGVGVGNARAAFAGARLAGQASAFADGVTLHGTASEELTRLCNGAGLIWSIQEGQLLVLPIGGTLDRTAIRLAADSGMIESPAFVDRRTVKAKCLIQPGLVPGQRVVVDSRLVQAELRVSEVTFAGETEGPSWEAELTLKRPLGALLDQSTPGVTAEPG
ncbi:MAG: hypothetical protein EPO40_06315 [Myxococcaceae bacterium]|nr:MAG: hypothetical protein EPO40_06315 [Myxococcaceae bacterium]